MDIRLGSILLWKRSGPIAGCLAPLIKYIDRDDWIRQNWQLWWPWWHCSQIVGYDSKEGWILDEANAGNKEQWFKESGVWWKHEDLSMLGGDRRVPLNRLGKDYLVVNWLPELTEERCDEFIATYACSGYNPFDYLAVALSRTRLPKWMQLQILSCLQECWDRTGLFCCFAGKPYQKYNEEPFMPELIHQATLAGILSI